MTDDELKRLLEANAAETRRHFDAAVKRLESRVLGLETQATSAAAETLRHFDVAIEHNDKRFDALAETVAHLDEKLGREAAEIREAAQRGFAETQAMIKFSHAELDRRVRSLEDGYRSLEEAVADMQVRLERLEGSTH